MKLTKELIKDVQKIVHAYCNGVNLYHMDEDDICQEIFIRLIESIHHVDVTKLCLETCKKMIDSSRPAVKIVSINEFVDENHAIEISNNAYENAIVNKIAALTLLDSLRPIEQQILHMHFGLNQTPKSNAHIACKMGISEEDIAKAIPVIIAKLHP